MRMAGLRSRHASQTSHWQDVCARADVHAPQSKMDLLWIWPTSGPEAFIQAHATPTCIAPEYQDAKPEDLLWLGRWYIRDVPYSAQLLVRPCCVLHALGSLGPRVGNCSIL